MKCIDYRRMETYVSNDGHTIDIIQYYDEFKVWVGRTDCDWKMLVRTSAADDYYFNEVEEEVLDWSENYFDEFDYVIYGKENA